MNRILVRFEGASLERLKISGYNIFLERDWKIVKEKIQSCKEEIRLNLFDIIKVCSERDIVFEDGNDFLSYCLESKMTENEYDSFTNIMPTYFGHDEIFEDVFKEVGGKC